ncbi:MAG: molybdenum cofactor biosynthesis protein MoaE [Anaerolineae bacterium]|nr:molybdenum cofactor biosynthesis protein MoaE [Anaerolineae bacterium]
MTESTRIHVGVRAFAALREALGFAETVVSVAPGTDIAGLMARLNELYPRAELTAQRYGVALNRSYAPLTAVLADGDEVALIPPVSGGTVNPNAAKLFEVSDQPLSLDDVLRRVVAPERGGVTLFAGTVRGVTRRAGEDEIATDYLEYEAYPEMAEETLARIAAEVQARWPSVSAVSIVHRVGRLAIGDLAVVIAVAASHRQDTFDACHYAIDRVKQIAPIWKKEVGPDGSFWVEGPESSVTG